MSRWLTKRDREICHHVYDHSVLTATQILKLHFTTLRGAEKRLKKLFERRVLDRFQPQVQFGSAPYHYILDELGMRVVAADRGLDLKRARQRLQTDLDIPARSHLHHQLEVNDFFVTLIKACRDSEGHYELIRWWNEKHCRETWKGIVHPDGLGELSSSKGSCIFLLELDRGTERGQSMKSRNSFARVRSTGLKSSDCHSPGCASRRPVVFAHDGFHQDTQHHLVLRRGAREPKRSGLVDDDVSTTSWRDESDGEFAVWRVRAESDDGRIETVRVMVDAGAVKHFLRDASHEFDRTTLKLESPPGSSRLGSLTP
jgi:Replication-relaxation